jgi:hypothetical protein
VNTLFSIVIARRVRYAMNMLAKLRMMLIRPKIIVMIVSIETETILSVSNKDGKNGKCVTGQVIMDALIHFFRYEIFVSNFRTKIMNDILRARLLGLYRNNCG